MNSWRIAFSSVNVKDVKQNAMFESVMASTMSYDDFSQVTAEHDEILSDIQKEQQLQLQQQLQQQVQKDKLLKEQHLQQLATNQQHNNNSNNNSPTGTANSAAFSPVAASSIDLLRIEYVEFQDWTVDDVIEWFKHMRDEELRPMDQHYTLAIQEHNIDGKLLSTATDEMLVGAIGLGLVDYHKRKFIKELDKLKKCKSMLVNQLCLQYKFNFNYLFKNQIYNRYRIQHE